MDLFGPMHLVKGEDKKSSFLISNANKMFLLDIFCRSSCSCSKHAQHVTCISSSLKMQCI